VSPATSTDPFEDPRKHKQYLKIAASGGGGVGKTRFALSFPKCCVIDTEKGTQPYVGKYDFKSKFLNRWRQLDGVLSWLRAHPGVYETLVLDSATVFYLDLIQDIVDYIKNKRGHETMSTGDWGVEKRRWGAFLNQLVELPMNVILSFREKAEYEDLINKRGEEVRKKTGEFLPEWDRQTEYLFDLGFRCYTEEDKKNKTSKFLVQCTKSRFDWMPKYSVHDITSKRAYAALFEAHVVGMLDAPEAPAPQSVEPLVVPDVTSPPPTAASVAEKAAVLAQEAADLATGPGAPEDPPTKPEKPLPPEIQKSVKEINDVFGIVKPSPDQPEATLDDIKVLMTRAGDMSWPDDENKCRKQRCPEKKHHHPSFTGKEGKAMLKGMYGVESSKELRKPQVDFLFGEFGKVLAGRAFLDRDGKGEIYVATPSGTTEEEVKAKVLLYVK
jgi:hypothetical protein